MADRTTNDEPKDDPPPVADGAGLGGVSADRADALARVVDDAVGREAAAEWAAAELVRGRGFEAVAADLVARGWASAAAADLIESARQATRDARGVRTREAVARDAERRYRRTMTTARYFAFGGLPALFLAPRNLIVALRGVWAGRRRRAAAEPLAKAAPAARSYRRVDPIQALEERRG